MRPRQVAATVAAVDEVGVYQLLTLHGSELGAGFVPGQFAALAVGDEPTSMLSRRCFSIHRAEGDALQIVVAGHGPGTRWLSRRRAGDVVDVVAPLGRGFPLPVDRVGAGPGSAGSTECTLVGGGYGSAPLFALAGRVRARGHAVHMVLGAATEDRLFGVDEAKAIADAVTVTTEDGSLGRLGRVSDVLADVIPATTPNPIVYACGPMAMLRAVTRIAVSRGATAYTAVEEAMACGIGICMTCVLPVVGDDGRTRMTRACTEGPVFEGSRVRWDDVGTVPADCLGAAMAGAS